MYSALYTEFVSFVCLFVFSCISEIVGNPRIKYMRSLLLIWYLCSCILRFLSLTLTLCSFFLGNPRTLYGQDLAFRLSVKCKAPFQKEKKCRLAFTLSSGFLAASVTTVAELLRTLCAALVVVLLREEIPFVVVFLC